MKKFTQTRGIPPYRSRTRPPKRALALKRWPVSAFLSEIDFPPISSTYGWLRIGAMIRIVLPFHLRTLARVDGEVTVEAISPVTLHSVLDALEAKYPMLRGTIRDHGTLKRRPFIRFFACGQDFSNSPTDTPLPDSVAKGTEPLHVVGAIAGG